MAAKIRLGEISVDVIFKDIKNLHLSVYPPTGRVRISAPERMKLETIRVYAISKLDWIRRHQRTFQEQERETPREYLDRESHYLWGKRYLLQLTEVDAAPAVTLNHRKIVLRVRPGTSLGKKQAIFAQFYRDQVKATAPSLIAKWAPIMGVSVDGFYVQQMKTKWGSCNPRARAIRLNTELAKRPRHCLEYIVVHEMVHFLEPHHGDRFANLMDRFMPQWHLRRAELNRAPLSHENWSY